MRYVKFTILGLGALSFVLSISYGALSFGGQGVFLLVTCLLPALLATFGTFVKPTMPRWASFVSALSFLIVGMKTSGGSSDLQNVMLLGFVGLILSLVIAIRPDRAALRAGSAATAGA
jgi:hypothetical protein